RKTPLASWFSSWSWRRRKLGEDCKVKTSCQKSSRVSNSKTESKSRPKPNPPLDSRRHPKSAIADRLTARPQADQRSAHSPQWVLATTRISTIPYFLFHGLMGCRQHPPSMIKMEYMSLESIKDIHSPSRRALP